MSKNQFEEYVIDGAFVKCLKILFEDDDVKSIANQHSWIKLSEIKTIIPITNSCCIFSLYKDTHYMVDLSYILLKQEINRFLFSSEDCSFSDNN